MRHFLSIPAVRLLRWCLVLLLPACTDPYLPDVIKDPPSYLVVDGFLNSKGVSTIKLTRTYAIGSTAAAPTESKATVYLEEEAGPRTQLREAPLGTYTSPTALALNPAKRYRLHLNTFAGQEYASDFVPVKNTPPIDDLNWRAGGDGASIYVNTHDATNATQYYRWDYVETWEITPVYRPTVEYAGGAIIRQITVPYPNLCWGTAPSTIVQIEKTTALTQDVVKDFRLRVLPQNSERLYTRYSMLVNQYALTKAEYAYWELLRKNTESIGSLFDPQPVQLTGNVHCLSTPTALALGFVSAHSVESRRLFINRQELPPAWRVLTGYEDCMPPDSVFFDRPPPPMSPKPSEVIPAIFGSGQVLPIEPIYGNSGVRGYVVKVRDCVDCRRRGTSVKPSFW